MRKLSAAGEVAEAGVECEAIAETVEVFRYRDATERPVQCAQHMCYSPNRFFIGRNRNDRRSSSIYSHGRSA